MDENEESLRQAVMYLRWELERMPQNHPERAEHFAKIAAALLRLFERTREITVLREAVTACRTAITLTAEDHGRYTRDLRQLLLRLFQDTTDLDPRNLEQALLWAYPSTPDAAGAPRSGVLAELATALRREYQQTDDLPTLRDAVATARRVVELTHPDDPHFGTYQADLASLLWSLSGRDGDLDTLDEAARTIRTSLPEVPQKDEVRGARVNLLALILKRR